MPPDSPTAAAATDPDARAAAPAAIAAPAPAPAAPGPALKPLPMPSRLCVPYTTRAAAESVQAKPPGTRVRRGQSLTQDVPQLGHAPLAPADGIVIGVEAVRLLDGRAAMAVVFEPGAGDAPDAPGELAAAAPRAQPSADLFGDIHPGEKGSWIEELRHAGIWADRWGSPDLVGQLHQTLRRPIDTVVCSVLDADRAVPVQSVVADTFGAELAAGVALLTKIAGAERAWVVADILSPDAFQVKLRSHAESAAARLVPLQNEYPQGDPTLLVHALLQRRLPPDHLPTDAGVLLLDAAAAIAVGRFALRREPMLAVPLAVYDADSDRTTFADVPVGAALRDVLAHVGVEAEFLTLRGGPPPRDLRVDPSAVAGGAELTAYVTAPEPDVNPDPCIRCGWCVEGCPVRIHPAGLLDAAQAQDPELADAYGLAACIQCGICNYVCPSHLPLLEGIRSLRRRT